MVSVTEGTGEGTEALASALNLDVRNVRERLDEVVRGTVEQTLTALLDAEADAVGRAGRFEHSSERQDTHEGSHQRKLETKAGVVRLNKAI